MNFTAYHAKYFAYELTRKRSSDDIDKLTASLQDAKVDLNPHQVKLPYLLLNPPCQKGLCLPMKSDWEKPLKLVLFCHRSGQNEIEDRMEQKQNYKVLFTIRWTIRWIIFINT